VSIIGIGQSQSVDEFLVVVNEHVADCCIHQLARSAELLEVEVRTAAAEQDDIEVLFTQALS
jgi:hypothetical protein